MKTIAIYHKDCSDGTTAAAVVLKKFPGALLFPMSYGYPPDEMSPIVAQAELGDQIFTVDTVMGAKEFLAVGHKVVSIDHHEGVQAEYAALAKANPAFTFVYDNDKSGASGTWAYLFPGEDMPELVKYVEDFDLWNWKYGDKTKAVASYLFMIMNDPGKTLELFDAPLDGIFTEGGAIARYGDFMVDRSIKNVEPLELKAGAHTVHVYNITQNKSEAGNKLAIERKSAVGLFTIHGKDVRISFRSLDGQVPSALDIATALGGGGHHNASAASIPFDEFIKAIVKK